jgi:hypothetical protein
MQTKANLEADIAALRLRVAELEGMVRAYEYAISHNIPLPATTITDPFWWWQPQVFNNTMPVDFTITN